MWNKQSEFSFFHLKCSCLVLCEEEAMTRFQPLFSLRTHSSCRTGGEKYLIFSPLPAYLPGLSSRLTSAASSVTKKIN